LFWKFGGNWLHIVFQQIVLEAAQIWWKLAPHYFLTDFLEAAQIWREMAPHYFPEDCFGGISDLEGTGSTLFSHRLFLRQLKFGGELASHYFWQIVLEVAQIWRELAPHYFPTDCFGG
jgi:hypothetical protein